MPIVRHNDQYVEKVERFNKESPNLECWITEPGYLTQFGAFIHVLQPGTQSSIKHWHSHEDELIYVLEGEVVVLEGDTETILQSGDAAVFKAGEPVGHTMINVSQQPTKVLVVGARAQQDCVTYPDHDRKLHRDRSQPQDRWTDLQNNPATNPYAA
ncbi:MAG: cupin domain-containing protein [Pseudomonadales bacterium]